MDFFREQRRAQEQSKRLLFLFLVAVALIVVVVATVVSLGWAAFSDAQALERGVRISEILPVAFIAGLATLALIALASWTRTSGLRAGGGAVARELGATLIPPDTTNPSYRRLRNVVEEIAIAAGVPVPEIYVLEEEAGINAFAAGYTPRRCRRGRHPRRPGTLNRAELQGWSPMSSGISSTATCA
jgi:Zn-dependent protease with chaperone function